MLSQFSAWQFTWKEKAAAAASNSRRGAYYDGPILTYVAYSAVHRPAKTPKFQPLTTAATRAALGRGRSNDLRAGDASVRSQGNLHGRHAGPLHGHNRARGCDLNNVRLACIEPD